MTFSNDADGRRLGLTQGDILCFSADTNELVGITIPFFEHRTGKGETIAIPDEALHLPADSVLG